MSGIPKISKTHVHAARVAGVYTEVSIDGIYEVYLEVHGYIKQRHHWINRWMLLVG